jgi:hypothetical protein
LPSLHGRNNAHLSVTRSLPRSRLVPVTISKFRRAPAPVPFPPRFPSTAQPLPPFNKSPTRRPPPISPRESTSSPLRQCALIRPPRFLRQAMDRRLRGSPRAAGRDNRHHHNQRFLRPGALARLRDSRIVARSLRSSACLLLPRPVPAPPPVSAEQGGVPRFLGAGGWGPGRYPLRRRVAAARGAFFSPPDPEAFLDALAP